MEYSISVINVIGSFRAVHCLDRIKFGLNLRLTRTDRV